jgi:uncharacterized protein YukE
MAGTVRDAEANAQAIRELAKAAGQTPAEYEAAAWARHRAFVDPFAGESRDEFYRRKTGAPAPKIVPLPSLGTALKRLRESEARALSGETVKAPPARKRAPSAKVENLRDAAELRQMRDACDRATADRERFATELASVKQASAELARLLDESRNALAVANARVSQLEAGESRDDGMPSAAWESRVRDLESQVAGFLRWGVAS